MTLISELVLRDNIHSHVEPQHYFQCKVQMDSVVTKFTLVPTIHKMVEGFMSEVMFLCVFNLSGQFFYG